MKNKPILVPYDFTNEAMCALLHAVKMAETTGNKVVLNHILDKKFQSKMKSDKKTPELLHDELLNLAKSTGTAAEIDAIVREGDIFSTIPEIAKEIDAGLICFGTHGVHGMQHVLGAFALKLVTQATIPVVIVQRKETQEHGYKNIVFPVDESAYSKQKAYAVAEFAKVFNSTVHILPKHTSDEHFSNYISSNCKYASTVFSESNVAHKIIENNKAGAFAKQVIDVAASVNADLISITTQRSEDKSVGEIFVGSEDVKIINNDAQIPTLCINAVVSLHAAGLSGVTTT